MTYKVILDGQDSDGIITPQNYTEKGVNFDMNTKQYMKSHWCTLAEIRELRQKPGVGGSTIECKFKLPTGVTYKTAANSAVYAPNQPKYI